MGRRKRSSYYIYNSETLRNIRYFKRLCQENEIKFLLTGGMAVQAYVYSLGKIHPSRSTGDLDIIVSLDDKEKFETGVLTRLNPINVKRKETKIINGYIIYTPSGPYYSVSFVEKLPEGETVYIKRVEIPVESFEYLLVNKVRTYLHRGEQKDIVDIFDLLKLVAAGYKSINEKKLEDALNYYNISKEEFASILRSISI